MAKKLKNSREWLRRKWQELLSRDLTKVNFSGNAFYSFFAVFGLAMTGLLYGAAWGTTASLPVPEVVVPDMRAAFRNNIGTLVDGYPIESMVSDIAKQDKTTAAFLVGIAKKESNWGKRVPRAEDGSDCYNYWGYRGAGSRGIAMGHGCFGSPEEAVAVVGGRIGTFVHEYNFRTPQELIVWKCGWSCDGHSSQSVKKWIADVGYYARKVKQ